MTRKHHGGKGCQRDARCGDRWQYGRWPSRLARSYDATAEIVRVQPGAQPVVTLNKTWLDESTMSPYKQMTTIALGRILVAIGNAILEEQSPPKSEEPVESVFRLKRPRGLDQFALNAKKGRRESMSPSVGPQAEAEESQTAQAVDSQAAKADESQTEVVEAAEAVESPTAEAVDSPTANGHAVEAAKAPRARTKRIKLRVTGDDAVAVDWNELLEPCPIAEATTAKKVLEVARQKYGVAAARMHFSRDKQMSMPGPDGKAHRVFKHGLPKGLAWKLK